MSSTLPVVAARLAQARASTTINAYAQSLPDIRQLAATPLLDVGAPEPLDSYQSV